MDDNEDLAWIKTDNGRGRKREVSVRGRWGCAVLLWAAAVLALAACAGQVVRIWQEVEF